MLPLIRTLYRGPFRHLVNLIGDANYRRWSSLETKYRLKPRYHEFITQIDGLQLSVPDSHSFLSSYKDIFRDEIYKFKTDTPQPYIIDIGSNIGLSVLFFKKIYPNAQITAIEADPHIFKYLKKNIHGNGFTDITLINKAAWDEDTTLKFSSKGADVSRIAYTGDENIVSVPAFNVSILLNNKPVDMLKIDIEGAEKIVLEACKNYLSNVNNLIVEYHSKVDEEQQLDKILSILRKNDFRIYNTACPV